jgi:hypothetical protein
MSKARKPLGNKIIKDFDGNNSPDNFNIPSIGIEDIDRAIFELFEKKINFEVSDKGVLKKVPVIFASGERFALTRRKNPIRDKNNAIILPVISIMRGEIDITSGQAAKGTAISFREQSKYIIKYRLSEKDRRYQNIINRMGIKNQKNVSSLNTLLDNEGSTSGFGSMPGTVATRRSNEALGYNVDANASLKKDLKNNIFEIIEVPYPEFVAITYDVIFWTQYMQQSNQMIETLMMNFTGQGEEIPIKTNGGYELVAFFKGNISSNSNLDDYTDSERIIKHTFSVTVPGYIINPKHPGMPNLVRRYLSAPTINFSYESGNVTSINYQPETKREKVERHVLTDITNINEDNLRRGESRIHLENFIENPFTGNTKTNFSRIKLRNARTGETVASSKILSELEKQQE